MNKTKYFLILLFVVLAYSCSNDDDSNNENTVLKVQLIGTATTGNCQGCASNFNIKIEYLSDGEIVNSETFSGSGTQQVMGTQIVEGNLLGAIVSMPDFDENNPESGRGTELENYAIKILDAEDEVIFIDVLEPLFINTDSRYRVRFEYDLSSGEKFIEYDTDGF